MEWPIFSKKVSVSSSTIVSLTQEGRNKAETQEGVGDLGAILATLQFGGSNSSYSISELSDRTGIPEKRIADIVRTNRTYILIKSATD
jgi:hypothetical protein